MKIGIFLPGLGQSFIHETVEKYAERLMNEISYTTTGREYELKTEKVTYTGTRISNVVSIWEKGEQGKVIYKIYDFEYYKILTERFNSHSLLMKNLLLFLLVLRKTPLIVKRLFIPTIYNRPFQTGYLFTIFMVIACSVLLMLPATFGIVNDFFNPKKVNDILVFFRATDVPFISKPALDTISKTIVSLTALLLLILPNANVLVTNLAIEFMCANDYIERGKQRQFVQGNLDQLVEYISEHEKDRKIHFHSYSFGTILAIDYLYPYGNKPSKNVEKYAELLITIGTPYEFVKSYYTGFYDDRLTALGDQLCWINVYSIADALATNFRKDAKIGEAGFGIDKSSKKPININYEVTTRKRSGIISFFILDSLKAHGKYWDIHTDGQSCLRLVYDEMSTQKLI